MKKGTSKRKDRLYRKAAVELLGYLVENQLMESVHIYAGGFCWTDVRPAENIDAVRTDDGCWIYEFPREKIPEEYACPDTLTMTFEGVLYNIMASSMETKARKRIEAIAKKYNCYVEMAHPWSLVFAEN